MKKLTNEQIENVCCTVGGVADKVTVVGAVGCLVASVAKCRPVTIATSAVTVLAIAANKVSEHIWSSTPMEDLEDYDCTNCEEFEECMSDDNGDPLCMKEEEKEADDNDSTNTDNETSDGNDSEPESNTEEVKEDAESYTERRQQEQYDAWQEEKKQLETEEAKAE